MTRVIRTSQVLSRREGLTSLEQIFLFEGANPEAVGDVLLTAPLVGSDSVFGRRPGEEIPRVGTSRALRGFSPAPGFRFDVELTPQDEQVFLVHFSQPDREVPYLQGDLVWRIADRPDGVVLDEQINTGQAFEVADEALTGPRPSLRRWLFFRVGHRQVMARATANIAALLDA